MKSKNAKKNSQSSGRNTYYLVAAVLTVVTALLYAPVLQHGFFAIDDATYVTGNAFLSHPSLLIFKTFVCQNYHPFTIFSLALDYITGGDKAAVYHRTNLLLHIINCMLVLVISKKLLQNIYTAGLVALLFAVHPLHVESVAWISERKDLLYSLFYMAALIGYCSYLKNSKLLTLLVVFVFFGCSLLSKPQAVPLPFILLLFDFYFGRTDYKKIIIEKIPFFLLSLTFGIIALYSQQDAINDFLSDVTVLQRMLIICYSLLVYFVKLVIPFNLSVFYPYPATNDIPVIYYVAPLVIATLCYLIFKNRKNKMLVFGSLFFLISLLPVLQLKSFGAAILAERYTYISSIGIFLMAAHFINTKINASSKNKIVGALTVYVVAICVITSNRLQVWESSQQLLRDADEKYPSVFVKQTLANVYGQLGKSDSGRYYINEAMLQQPGLPMLYFTRAHFCGNNLAAGIKDIDTAVTLDSSYAVAYLFKGLLYAQQGNRDSAFYYVRKGNNLRKTVDGPMLLAQFYEQEGNYDSSKYYFKQAYLTNPSDLAAYRKLYGK